jgi:nucleoside-diphosphate-sugar epimerase
MKINIVIGKKSNLSTQLKNSIDNIYLISTLNIVEEFEEINFNRYDTVNIIFNQFQAATKLSNLDKPVEYINRTINSTAIVLDYIKVNIIKVNKIIYTSSSSVYGDNTFCSENDIVQPLSLHASLKISNERLIELFAVENGIDYTISRVFNMYGGDDNFSIISKIINAYKNDKELSLINNGEAIRDFIHIDDVVNIYKELLIKKDVKILNIGAGQSKSILFIIDFLRQNDIFLKTASINRKELKVSICNTDKLKSITSNLKFKNVEDFLLSEIKDCK